MARLISECFHWVSPYDKPRREKTVFAYAKTKALISFAVTCENKDADQLRGNREADQRLCFRNTDSRFPLLPKSEISSL